MSKIKKVKKKVSQNKIFKAPAKGPKVLIYDIETAPLLGYCWSLWENNIGLNQIYSDWYVLSWSAKWLGAADNEIMYMDQRDQTDIENDKTLLQGIWNLLDEADIVITQNGKSFDQKKLNARFIMSGFQPPSSYKHIDTKQIASRHFKFSSNKLEFMTDKLCVKYKKSTHKKFAGFELWKQCLAGNIEAWNEMRDYNKIDVLSLEELYVKLIPWTNSVNFNLYTDDTTHVCKCGSEDFHKNGFYFTTVAKYQKHKCKSCGSEIRDRINLLSDEKRESLKTETIR